MQAKPARTVDCLLLIRRAIAIVGSFPRLYASLNRLFLRHPLSARHWMGWAARWRAVALSAALIFIVSAAWVTTVAVQRIEAQPVTPVSGGTYVVRPGDSWTRISRDTGISIRELQAANPQAVRPTGWLIVGEVLRLPGQASVASPSVDQKPSLTNLLDQLSNGELESQIDAAYQLGDGGAAAATAEVVTALIAATQNPDADLRIVAAFALAKLDVATDEVVAALTRLLQDEQPDVRLSAARSLGHIGAAARAASETLLTVMTSDANGDVRHAAAVALSKTGLDASDAALAKVIKALADPNWYVRKAAASILASADGADVALVNVLTDRNTGRALQNSILGMIDEMPAQIIEQLLPGLMAHNTRPTERMMRMIALLEVSPIDREESILRTLVRSQHPVLRASGVRAMEYRGLHYLQDLIDLALGNNEPLRKSAVIAIAHTEPAATAQAVGALTTALGDPAKAARAAWALGEIGVRAEQSVPALLSLLTHSTDNAQRLASIAALGQIAATPKQTLPVLLDIANNSALSTEERLASLRSIGQFGRSATVAAQDIAHLLNDTDPLIQLEALKTLSAVDVREPDSIEMVTHIMIDSGRNEDLRIQAIDHLSRTGTATAPVIEGLLGVMADGGPQLQMYAAQALGQKGALAAAAIPELDLLMDDADSGVADAAATALGNMAPLSLPLLMDRLRSESADDHERAYTAFRAAGQRAIPGLICALSQEETEIRLRIIQAFDKIGPSAIWGLWAAMSDPDEHVRTVAEEVFDARFAKHKQIGNDRAPVILKGFAVKEAIPFLVAALQSDDDEVKQQAASALAILGPDAAEAAPLLGLAVAGGSDLLQCSATFALLLIGPDGAASAPYLAHTLETLDENRQCQIDEGVRRLAYASPHVESLSDIIDLSRIDDGNTDLRTILAETLAQYGDRAGDAAPVLADLLFEEDQRIYAAQALGAIGGAAIPDLRRVLAHDELEGAAVGVREALNSKNNDLRRSALYALSLVKGLPSDVTLLLWGIVRDETEDIDIRRMAATALQNHGHTLSDFWQNHSLSDPQTRLCPQWTEEWIMDMPVAVYDRYWEACYYAEGEDAPPIVKLFRAVVRWLRGR